MPMPTFVIAGAQKCGTSSLTATLRQHPQFFMSMPKELHFFDRHFDRGLSWYREQFTPAGRHLQIGEATPAYLYDAEARARLAETLPAAKFVVILRDPVKRAYSHYWHTRRRGQEDETFERALELEARRLSSNSLVARSRFSYADRGHYVDQLSDLEARHDRSLIHLLLLEDLIADRQATLRQLLEFLGADTGPLAGSEVVHVNRHRVRSELTGRKEVASYPPMEPETAQRLSERFAESTRRLSEWLGRDLSVWSSGQASSHRPLP
jgi:hypothetical protein